MAIKDQCDNCRKRNTADCTETVVFNGNSCLSYSKGINLEKVDVSNNVDDNQSENQTSTEEDSEVFVYTSEYLKENTSIHGWLSFFLFILTLGGLISGLYPIATFNVSEYDGNYYLAWGDVAFGILLLAVATLTVYSFIQRKPDAVFLGKTYQVAVFASSLLNLLLGGYSADGVGSMPQLIRSLVWSVIWFCYLTFSNQVNEVIPKSYRRINSKDFCLAGALLFVPLLLMAIGLSNILNSREKEAEAFLERIELSEDERSDGRIVFEIPRGFTCEENFVTEYNLKIYYLESEDIGSITLCSDYDGDKSKKNFLDYCENWEDEDAKDYSSEIVTDDTRTANGNSYYYRAKKYDINGSEVFWRFCLMFDTASSKVCIISCYDNGYDDYLYGFLQSIRFQ